MAWAALIPAATSLISSFSQSGQGGGAQQAQGGQGMQMPANPFPQNFPDGGKKPASIFDLYNGINPQQQGQQAQGGAQSNFMVPGGGKPLSVVDAFLPGGTSPSIFNPIQDPLQSGLGGILKGIFK